MTLNSDNFFSTIAIFGIVSFVIYFILSQQHRTPAAQIVRNDTIEVVTNTSTDNSSARKTTNEICRRVPSHVSLSSAKIAVNGGSNVLVDGIVAFRHTKAFFEEPSITEEQLRENRKDRAILFSKLLDDSSSPPSKGSTVVVSFQLKDVGCSHLRRVLYLLGTSYSLFIIIVVIENSDFEGVERENVILRLRGESTQETHENDDVIGTKVEILDENVLPTHRIIASNSVAGRVAFVRQLQRIELMVDFELEVKQLLSRFGHRVIFYGKENNDLPTGCSKLGGMLI